MYQGKQALASPVELALVNSREHHGAPPLEEETDMLPRVADVNGDDRATPPVARDDDTPGVLPFLACLAGALLGWLGLLAALYLSTDSIWPAFVASATFLTVVAWRLKAWSRSLAMALVVSGLLTLLLLGWLGWDFASTMAEFD